MANTRSLCSGSGNCVNGELSICPRVGKKKCYGRTKGIIPEPKLISTWAELAGCESRTHTLEIDIEGCNGWVRRKKSDDNSKDFYDNNHYLSTHTFYGSQHKHSTELLQSCGFNVVLENWDA